MSSFIIGKREYVKAAGLMCGIEEAKRDSDTWFLENVRKEFEHCYALNVLSVNEQYNDNCKLETEKYDEVFESYRKMGALIGREGYSSDNDIIYEKVADVMDKRTFRTAMWKFFNSVLYQIEDEACYRVVAGWFYICLKKLYESEVEAVEGWWGEIELAA